MLEIQRILLQRISSSMLFFWFFYNLTCEFDLLFDVLIMLVD